MDVDPSAETAAGVAAAVTNELAPGATIGKYRLDAVLGTGGMGVVWRAFDPDLERAIAIKVLRVPDAEQLRTRLLREARAMARLKHPNVLTVYDVGTDRNRDYIAMELVEGADVDAWLATKPPRPDVLAMLFAAGRGLAAAHDAGLIHRDFKPHNIMRSRDGHVYVTDFGLARGEIEEGVELVQTPATAVPFASGSLPRMPDAVLDSRLTQTGVLIGTPAYMAPEQFTGRSPDPRSDQFAFCVTAWEALTGTRPFRGKSLDELRDAPAAGAQSTTELPPRIRDVLTRGLAPAPDQRWPDMHALLRALDTAIAPPQKRSRLALWTAAVVAVAAVGTGVTMFAMRSRTPRTAAAADCAPAEEAFGSAWSADRRKAVVSAHKGARELLPVTAVLDDVRRKWTRSYQAVCAMPASAKRHERLACLLEVRDEVAEATGELTQADAELGLTSMISVAAALSTCEHE